MYMYMHVLAIVLYTVYVYNMYVCVGDCSLVL